MADLDRVYAVICELRPNLSREDFFSIYHSANAADGYQIVAVERTGSVTADAEKSAQTNHAHSAHTFVAAMGYRVLHDFVHGKHLYIDDLVCTQALRSQGLGAQLLRHAEKLAAELDCKSLRLCTGIDNLAAKRFYERNEWQMRSVVYKKKL